MGIDFLAYGYAALVATGGAIGYAKAGKIKFTLILIARK